MNTILYQVDSFTKEPFKGNPAGVMILDQPMSVDKMQNIAMEMNLSETAFVYPNNKGFDIRYFTPTVEIPLCGHATLASAHILYEIGIKKKTETLLFKAKGGDLTIYYTQEGIQMSFPAYEVQKINIPKNFKQILGFTPIEMYKSNANWTIAVASTEIDIQNANPSSFQEMIDHHIGHLMITASGDISHTDYVVRCFAPEAGINEDPVTGSAQCALAPLWNLKTGKNKFTCKQISTRTGLLNLELENQNVLIKGNAITIFKAELSI